MENQPKNTEEFFRDLRHPLYNQVEQGTRIGIRIAPQGNCRPCYITIDDIKYKIKHKRGWRDAPAVKSSGCSSRGPESIPTTHMVAHTLYTWILRPLLAKSHTCRHKIKKSLKKKIR